MSQKLFKKTTLLVSTIFLSGVVFSAPVDKEELVQECKYLGMSLSQLANANTKEYCSVDVNYSGILMEQSASLIKANRIQFAIDNLALVHRTLERVSTNDRDCTYFSSMVTPYLEKTTRLTRQLESTPHVSSNE